MPQTRRKSSRARKSLPGPRAAYAIEPAQGTELGATPSARGVRFAVYSRHARAVRLALFDPDGSLTDLLPLPSCHGHVFQGFVPGLRPGALYGFFAEGPFDPRQGHRFNPEKLLLDPYARALWGSFRNPDGVLCGHVPGGEDADLAPDRRPSHPYMPKCVVTESRFDWQGVKPPGHPRDRLLIYELHVKGFTAHRSARVSAPGTYLGLIEKIPYLKSLGVNAVELLPVHAKYSEDFLGERGLSNYWGYNTAAFFALEPSYGSGSGPGAEVDEFKTLVRELHRAGIEVILDVVYNHTAEGNELGPTLSLRGLDNRSYYALTGTDDAPWRKYWNHTGCGNTLDFGSPAVLRLVLDSLRTFVREFHVDGFRFDLATVHGRQGGGAFQPAAPFFAAASQDPVLRRVKLIAEPWDMGAYAVGRFPDGWMEWNGSFRDAVRRWTRGEDGLLPAVGDGLEGSSGAFAEAGREPWATVNFATCHDGFTLRDLVSYDRKRNAANGENNWDGGNDNHSWNCGEEGETDRADVEALRRRQARNLLVLVLLARGTPMLLAGDEFLRSQGGNNNAYCQDNAISWLDWKLAKTHADFLRFARNLIGWRRLLGVSNLWADAGGRSWGRCWAPHDAAGRPHDPGPERHGAFLLDASGALPGRLDPDRGAGKCYLLLNADSDPRTFHLPHLPPPWRWGMALDTSFPAPEDISDPGSAFPLLLPDRYEAAPRSSVLLLAMRPA